ncbi:MAG: flagellin lysine-N-methylase [Thermoflexaceae bacterium]|nr:flagellin lysine-N-methylase [Thermoflexaceae bacterium]
MLEIKPKYYSRFHCTADKCPMTCCREWKIAVDEETYEGWKNVEFDGAKLTSYVTETDTGRIICLNQEKKCPFLNEKGLCSLVICHGDEILSQTCDIFPRQIHDFEDRRELSLVSCCPEVVDMLYREEDMEFTYNLEKESEDELFAVRNLMIDIVKNKKYPVQISLLMAFYILLDIYGKNEVSFGELLQYRKEELLDELYAKILEAGSSWEDTFDEDNELWLDMVENYRKEGLYTEYIGNLSELAEKLLETYDRKNIQENLAGFLKYFREYENLFRNFLISEFFTNMLLPEADMEEMVIMMQWIAMEFVLIRQGLFLKWMENKESVSYETVRDYIVVISRMTGYDEEDIFEYMENSFQSLVWEWGYMALIVGGLFDEA